MNNTENCGADMAFHPGYYVEEIVEDMGITQHEFASRLGVADEVLEELIRGKVKISNSLANRLSRVLGSSPDFWLNLQERYDKKTN